MSNRLQFWLGLLLGAFAVLRLRLPKLPPPPSAHEVVKDILDGALVICDSRGRIPSIFSISPTQPDSLCRRVSTPSSVRSSFVSSFPAVTGPFPMMASSVFWRPSHDPCRAVGPPLFSAI